MSRFFWVFLVSLGLAAPVGAQVPDAALAIACYLFVVGDIKRVKLVTSLSAR